MKKLIVRMYTIVVILFFLLMLYSLFALRLDTKREIPVGGYSEITDTLQYKSADSSATRGEKIVITFRSREIQGDYNVLAFYTQNQEVRVYSGSECIYDLEAKDRFMIPKTPGVCYNLVTLPESANDQRIRIELYPVYAYSDKIPEVYLGNRHWLIRKIIYSDLLLLTLCAFTIILGTLLLFFAVLDKGQHGNRREVAFRGFYIIMISCWKIMDCSAVGLFCAKFPVISLVSFFILMLMPIFSVDFLFGLTAGKRTMIWELPKLFSSGIIVIIFVLQMTRISDFYESLWLMQISLGFSMICAVIGLSRMIRTMGFTRNLKIAVSGLACFGVWVIVDILNYYASAKVATAPLSMLVFLSFMFILSIDRLRLSKKRMEEGMHARAFEKLAYYDVLTGFYNRAAQAEFLNSREFVAETSVMVAFDLNDLKKCNDQYGHDKGDLYIKECARIIRTCFGSSGRCYRLGGDEFGAILQNSSLVNCEAKIQRMLMMVDEFNENSKDIRMGIAYGCAVFDPEEDEDIYATIRRADKMMYEVKFRMKQEIWQ